MKDKKSFAFVDEFLSSGRWTVVVAGWGLGIFETKESAEHCARDINQAHADGIKEAETCRESGGTDSVCLKGHEDSMKEVRERERKAVAERDARIKGLEAEILESARLHGMGSQREAALEARIAELERVLESLVRAGNYLKETAETHVMQTYDTRGSVGRKISEWDAALADIKTVLGKGE